MTTHETFPQTWCRMWSEDPALAHELITDRGRQWASRTAALDAVVGPAETEGFVADYAVTVGTVFAPRVLVVGDDAVSYTWDATRRDGTVVTGVDVNRLRGGRVVENWTFATDARDERADPPPGVGSSSAADLAGLARSEADRRGVALHREPVVDAARQTAAYLWRRDEGRPGGVDVLAVSDGAVVWTWSLAASRPFSY